MEKNIKNGIVITVVGGLILTTILSLIALLNDYFKSFLSTIWLTIESFINSLAMSYTLPKWQLLIVLVFASITIVQMIFFIYKKIRTDTYNALVDYKNQVVDGLLWRFEWKGQEVKNLTPHCPVCDLEVSAKMNMFDEYVYFECENCNKILKKYADQLDMRYPRNRAKREIARIARGILNETEN